MDDARFQVLYDFQVRDERLERSAKLLDSINQNVERMTAGLLRLERGSGSAFGRIGEQADRSKRSVIDLAGAVYTVRSAFDFARGTIGAAVNALGQFGDSSIKAFGERTGTVRSYTTLLNGDRRQAELEFFRAQNFAQKTDFKSEQIETTQNSLLTQGFRDKDLYRAAFAASDIATAQPEARRNVALDAMTRGLIRVKQKGYLTLDELNEEFATAGLSTSITRDLAKKKYGAKSDSDLEKLFSDKKIRGNDALELIYQTVTSQLHTNKLGEFSTSSAGSLTSLISNRDEAFANLAKSFDADEALPAIARYKAALQEQSQQLDITTRSGKNMSLVLQDISNQAIDTKATWTEFSTGFFESFGSTYAKALKDIDPNSFDGSARSIETFGQSIGRIGSVAATAIHALDGFATGLALLSDSFTFESYRRERREQEEADKKTEEDVRNAALRRLSQAGLGFPAEGYSTLDLLTPGKGNFLSTYGPPTPTDDQLKDLQRAKEKKQLVAALAGGKSKADPGWNVPIWHYEPGAGGSSTLGASALNAVVESQVAGGAGERARPINVEKIEIVVMGASQSPQDIAHAVHEELVTKLRSLPRAPSLRR